MFSTRNTAQGHYWPPEYVPGGFAGGHPLSLIHSRVIVPFAVILVCVLFWFRPGGIEGPRPDPVQQQGKGFDHSLWTQVLSRIVQPDGSIDYAALRTDSGDFDRYLGMLRGTSPGSAPHRFRSSDDRLAYYLNAYNAFVVAAIRDHCPIKNVQEEYLGGASSGGFLF